MKKMLLGLALASTILMAGGNVAPADNAVVAPIVESQDGYFGVSTSVGVSDRNDIDWFGLTSVGVQAGYTIYRNENFTTSVEGRYTTDTMDWFDTYTYGLYAKPGYDMGGVTAYGLLGYQDGSSNEVLDFDGEFAYGGGVTTDVFGYDVFVDYVYGNDTKSEIVSIGMNYKFNL